MGVNPGSYVTQRIRKVDKLDQIIDILKKYEVQEWKEDYSFEDPSTYENGFGWNLWIQFNDGTVEKHGGSGSFAEEITPERFDDFYHELEIFVNERLEG